MTRPTREDLARLDRKRKNRMSNADCKHAAEDFAMRIHREQAPRPRYRRVIRRVLVQRDAHKRSSASESAKRHAIPRSLSMPSKPNQQGPEVDPGVSDGRPYLAA
jgi:hypothetical protein